MARPVPEAALAAIEAVVHRHPEGITASEIASQLQAPPARRTLQYRLKTLVDSGRLVMAGERRWARYHPPPTTRKMHAAETPDQSNSVGVSILLSPPSQAIRDYLRRPAAGRKPVGYDRDFLDSYRPDESAYLSAEERANLAQLGRPRIAEQPAGTYAKQILNRLLIDLSWNSSRLEGNTYSLLDTRRLIEFGEEAKGRNRLEAQMILNHKDAIEFLVIEADDIGFDRYTILNLHATLASNLLPDDAAAGRLRKIAGGIEQSVFHPLEGPQLIEECFDRFLATAAAIEDPFEQAFFFMVQLPYLQPFDDVNKRVSRVAANIPLIKANLAPLSFIDVPQSVYIEAILGVYELNRIDYLKDVFVWAYHRSAERYAAVRQSIGEPDQFRMTYRTALRELIGEIVRRAMTRREAAAHIAERARDQSPPADRERFRNVAEDELLALHEGNFARYRIRPSEFAAWQQVWIDPPPN